MIFRVLQVSIWELSHTVKLRLLSTTIETSVLGRSRPNPRAQFMSFPELIAILEYGVLGNSSKTVANLFVSGNKEEEDEVATNDWSV